MPHLEVVNVIGLVVVALIGAAQYLQSRRIGKAVDRLARAAATHAMLGRREIAWREAPMGTAVSSTGAPGTSADPDPDDPRRTRRMQRPLVEALAAAASSPTPAERGTIVPPPAAAEPVETAGERPSTEEVTQVTDRSVELLLEAAKAGELVRLDQEMRPVRPMKAPDPSPRGG